MGYQSGYGFVQAVDWGSEYKILSLNPNGGSVGIGTSNPLYRLDVSGSIRTQVGYIIGANANTDITLDGNTGTKIRYSGQSVTLDSTVAYISTNSTIRLYVTNAGDVGIGTTSPAHKLDVIGNARIGQTSNNSTNASLDITAGGSGFNSIIDFGFWGTFDTAIFQMGYFGAEGGAFKIRDVSAGPIYDRMILSGASLLFPSSSVGIGTTSVSARFEIKSSATNNLGGLLLRATSTANFPAVLYENSSNGGTLDLYNSATLTTRINSNGDSYFNAGNVGISTTTPTYKLDIASSGLGTTAGNQSLAQRISTTTSNSDVLEITNTRVSTGTDWQTAGYRIQQKVDSTWMGYIQFNGNNNGGISFGTGTDVGGPLNVTQKVIINGAGSVGINTTSPATTLHVQGTATVSGSLRLSGSAVGLPEHMVVALSDETTNLTTGTGKLTMRAPFAMRLTDLPRASLSTASTSGLVTVDINEAGTSVLGANKLSIDANELTSTTAATPTTIADALIADDAQIRFDIDAAGTGARGLKVTLYYIRV